MQEFIQSAVSQLGINEDQAKSATGGLLNFLKDQGNGDVQGLISKLPGAEDLMKSEGSGSESGGGGGMLGGLGSKLGGGGGALAVLQGSGLDASRAGSFVKMLVDYAKQKVGPEQVEQVVAKVPALKALM
ncbi:MAG: DUF2780 domain-containing protein [Candidatus Binatia bacterium]